jgi:hypothetical protein
MGPTQILVSSYFLIIIMLIIIVDLLHSCIPLPCFAEINR